MRFSDAVRDYLAEIRHVKRYSPWTVRGYLIDLTHLQHTLQRDTVLCVTPETLNTAVQTWGAAGVAQATLCRRQSAIRSFCKWGHKRRLWAENPALHLEDIRKPDSLPRPFDGDQAEQLFALELRDVEDMCRALLAYTGVRVGTLCAITIGAISFEPDGARIRVLTKGGRYQVIEANHALTDKLAAYLVARPGRAKSETLLANPYGKPYNVKTIWRWTMSWGERCEPPIMRCTPHRFRHEFATRLLEQTEDIRLVQEALGHRSIQSTQRYTRVHQSRLRAVMEKLTYGPSAPAAPVVMSGRQMHPTIAQAPTIGGDGLS